VEFLTAFAVSILSALFAGWDLGTALFLGKLAGGFFGARLARIGRPILVGSILVPRGEFSLVLAKTGVDAGLVGPQLYPVAGLAVLVTALASPLIDRLTRPADRPEGN